MADGTPIEWTDATWNPITGCSVVSPGCTNCYAMKLAGSRLRNTPSRAGLTQETKGGSVWTGEVRFNGQWLDQPLRWRRPRMIFVCAHADLFHENVPDEWIDRVFAVMALAPQHQFQVLTKRPERMQDYCCRADERGRHPSMTAAALMAATGRWNTPALDLGLWPLSNIWLGVSVEDHYRAAERIPILCETPAALRWVSAEPLLGAIHVSLADIDWVVAGGESGAGARPMYPGWVRSLRDQCANAGIPFLFKQWGSWSVHEVDAGGRIEPGMDMTSLAGIRHWIGDRFIEPDEGASVADVIHPFAILAIPCGKKRAGRLLDGALHDEFPSLEVPFG
ncbi:hypothetical protein NS365_21995 [Aureimonas ureilytica]|uniref:Phage protein Gp37/Gp68 n=1 Tax=Aureimonas ureilytica TaxID=401562 RepID=A0A175RHA1_9HYPH|nr:phage Gp37/Gp68 family protein [Aureimonas ureilytica]KTR02284.1 hypothetical protein NS365_21995 [Aureimonas ureilytica]